MSNEAGFHFHLAPRTGWCNDPNGVIFWRGRYHVFYQFVHDPLRNGRLCWAHASSDDGFEWQDHGVALSPDEPYENAGGCWSGSAVADGDDLVLIYTGDHKDAAGRIEGQCVARSSDGGVTFSKLAENPVLFSPETVLRKDFRDPKVWRRGEWWYMVVAGAAADAGARAATVIPNFERPDKPQAGQVLLYRSRDLRAWESCGVLLHGLGGCCECPDFFELDGRWVLVTSPYGSPVAVVGDFDWNTHRFTPAGIQRLDWGPDFYAPQTNEHPGFGTGTGPERWMIAWLGNWGYPAPQRGFGFSWSMTLPRGLRVVDGRVVATLPFETLRRHAGFVSRGMLSAGETRALGDGFELIAREGISAGGALRFTMRSPEDPEGRFTLTITAEGAFTLDRTRPDKPGRMQDRYQSDSKMRMGGRPVHIIVDRWSVEVFGAGGAAMFTAATDFAPGRREVSVEGAEVEILSP